MDKVQELINKTNREVEFDEKNNPFKLKVGHFVSVNNSSVYKIIKFTKDKGKCLAVVNLIMSDDGNMVHKLKPLTVELSKIKPLIAQVSFIRERLSKIQNLYNFVLENISNSELYKSYDNVGRKV